MAAVLVWPLTVGEGSSGEGKIVIILNSSESISKNVKKTRTVHHAVKQGASSSVPSTFNQGSNTIQHRFTHYHHFYL